MTIQAKRLRDYLKAHGLMDSVGKYQKTPRVRTKRFHRRNDDGSRFVEYGSAGATVYAEHHAAGAIAAEARSHGIRAQVVPLTNYTLVFLES